MKPLFSIFTLALVLGNSHAAETNQPATKPVNLLFIMTDQQRWDAMSCAGNTVLKTPHLDNLARQGTRFASFYSSAERPIRLVEQRACRGR